MGPKKYKSRFNVEWLEDKEFGKWLKQVPTNDKFAYCILCKVEFDVGSMKKSAITCHGRGERHKRIAKIKDESETHLSVSDFFKRTAPNTRKVEKEKEVCIVAISIYS